METCKYCGGTLSFVGFHDGLNYFSCSFCDLIFDENDVSKNRMRKRSVPESYEYYYNKKTKELLKCNTIELFHMLKDCRKDWYSMFSLLKNTLNEDPAFVQKNEIPEDFKDIYREFIYLSKQKFVIENIILEKAGFLPDKITDKFLNQLVEWGNNSSSKPMYIYIQKKVKKAE